GGLPSEQFLAKVDPLFTGIREKLDGECAASDQIAGTLSPYWAEKLGLKAGIPIPVGAFDAHWDAIGAGCRVNDVVNVIGTSTCIIGITPSVNLVPGVCGVVLGSVHPRRTGIEAGGIAQKNDVLNRVYASVLGRPVVVASKSAVSLGSAIFAFLAAGIFETVEEAQDRICPTHRVYEPDRSEQRIYDELYTLY